MLDVAFGELWRIVEKFDFSRFESEVVKFGRGFGLKKLVV